MGLGEVFKKKTNALEKVKEIENRDNFTPLNTYNLQNQIEAKEMIIDSQVAKLNAINNKAVKWNDWIRLNLWADYFANRFNYETSDYEHDTFINRVLRYGFIYGQVGVWNNNGTPMLVSLRNKKHINPNRSETYEVIVIQDDFNEYINESMLWDKPYNIANKEDVIFYRFNSLGYPAMIILEPIFKFEELTQKALYNETLSIATRIIQDVNTAAPSVTAAKQFLKFDNPIIQRVDGGKDHFSALSLDTNTQNLLETIEYTKNYYYDILGRRTNSDFKKAHSLDAELEASQINTSALERDKYMFVKKFLRDYSTMFNIEIYLENMNGEMSNVFDKMVLEQPKQEQENQDETSWSE